MTKHDPSSKQWFEREFRNPHLELRLEEAVGDYRAVVDGRVKKIDAYKVEIAPSTKYHGAHAKELALTPMMKTLRLQEGLEWLCTNVYGIAETGIYKSGGDVLIAKSTLEAMKDSHRPDFTKRKRDFFAALEMIETKWFQERLRHGVERRDPGLGSRGRG